MYRRTKEDFIKKLEVNKKDLKEYMVAQEKYFSEDKEQLKRAKRYLDFELNFRKKLIEAFNSDNIEVILKMLRQIRFVQNRGFYRIIKKVTKKDNEIDFYNFSFYRYNCYLDFHAYRLQFFLPDIKKYFKEYMVKNFDKFLSNKIKDVEL
jgi:hypothetical protein